MLIKILRILILTVILAISAFFLFAVLHLKEISRNDAAIDSEKPLVIPEFSGEKKINFTWKYNGTDYSIEEALYQSAYDFYRSQPKVYEYPVDETLPPGWRED